MLSSAHSDQSICLPKGSGWARILMPVGMEPYWVVSIDDVIGHCISLVFISSPPSSYFRPAFSLLVCPVPPFLCPHPQWMIRPRISQRKEEHSEQTFHRLPPPCRPICPHLELCILPSWMLLFPSEAPLSFAWSYHGLLLISTICSRQIARVIH